MAPRVEGWVSSQVKKSRRTDARNALLDIAGREEKLFSVANAYSATLAKMLEEKGSGRGLISICTAGGMGVTAIVERP